MRSNFVRAMQAIGSGENESFGKVTAVAPALPTWFWVNNRNAAYSEANANACCIGYGKVASSVQMQCSLPDFYDLAYKINGGAVTTYTGSFSLPVGASLSVGIQIDDSSSGTDGQIIVKVTGEDGVQRTWLAGLSFS